MKVKLIKNDDIVQFKLRVRYEYLICLLPFFGKVIGLIISIIQGKTRTYINIFLMWFFLYFSGGAIVYIFFDFLSQSIIFLLFITLILIIFWIIIPMYLVYVLIFYSDEIKAYKLLQKGYIDENEKVTIKDINILKIFLW